MTTRLRESLHGAAGDVPAYPVYEKALATARRSRRRAGLAAAAVLALVGTALPLVDTSPAPTTDGKTDAALPDRIGVPPLGSLHATDRPRLGSASVIFTGQGSGLEYGDEGSLITVVGAHDDRYRIIRGEIEARAGVDTVLSADGRQVAFRAVSSLRSAVEIVDLVTGHSRDVGSGVDGTVMIDPVAWSPDGRALVVRSTVPVDAERTDYRHVLSVVWPGTDRHTRLGEAENEDGLGTAVAFAPDGTRLAFQTGRTVTVGDVDGRRLASFTLAADAELAGKGAWSADAQTLTVARRGIDSWRLGRVDAATGRDLGLVDTPTVTNVTAIRLLGWAVDGSARVVAYVPGPHAPGAFNSPLDVDSRIDYFNVGTVRILALSPGASAPTTLLVAPDDVVSIDVADAVVHGGRTREAHPPGGVGPRFWVWTSFIPLLLAAIVAFRRRKGLALWLDDRRVTRSRG
ncbi:WD40 repeat protein [Asanoa ferruginea]|uniref:WD40 repeat protein n=1 Tax=Asanoa ferruginea TaxID=53367 RepID=A0A3E0A2L5_9ACTN|nr:PD40 domain-containing protein [Asanoa ferruginea]REG00521.1 WD40 repeat protein [Asanoa ferruginea]GIF47683.1 hypothetical protein Afe04nite_22220 [Asanoa ferruginea]